MTEKGSSSNDKKTGKRCTPKDLRVKGTLRMGVGLTRLLADGVYDTVSNWMLTDEIGLDFNPNLKGKFKKDMDWRPDTH